MKLKQKGLVLLLLVISNMGFGQISLRFKPYLGFGIRGATDATVPFFQVKNERDQQYYDLNLASIDKIYLLKGQMRFSLLHIGNFSFGYSYWSHRHEYSDDAPNDSLEVFRKFPSHYDIILHGITLAYHFNGKNETQRNFVPFILTGGGKYHGGFKHYSYQPVNPGGNPVQYKRTTTEDGSYSGWAAFGGIGAVVYKYTYFYIGLVNLGDESLPSRTLIDVNIGVTLP